MSEVKPPEFVVIKIPSDVARAELGTDDDRFVVFETATIPTAPPFAGATTGERLAAMQQMLATLPPLSEADVRGRLARRGLASEAIDAWLVRARRTGAVDGSTSFLVDHITRIGYRNPDGHEVTRKTERSGPGNQRVFMMRCSVCGHEYGSYGCDVDIRRCPACQDGARGVDVPV